MTAALDDLSASGINVTNFEEFCKREEEKARKKNEEQREFIDVKFSEETKTVEDNSADDRNDFVLSGKNKIDVAVRFLKSFLLKARLNCA